MVDRKNEFEILGEGVPPQTVDGMPAEEVRGGRGQIELLISLVLRAGVLISAMLIAIGLVILLVSLYSSPVRPTLASALSTGIGQEAGLQTPGGVLTALLKGDPTAIADLGLLVLLATPIVSVGISAVGYLLDRDKPFIAVTLFILAVLLSGPFLIAGQ